MFIIIHKKLCGKVDQEQRKSNSGKDTNSRKTETVEEVN